MDFELSPFKIMTTIFWGFVISFLYWAMGSIFLYIAYGASEFFTFSNAYIKDFMNRTDKFGGGFI